MPTHVDLRERPHEAVDLVDHVGGVARRRRDGGEPELGALPLVLVVGLGRRDLEAAPRAFEQGLHGGPLVLQGLRGGQSEIDDEGEHVDSHGGTRRGQALRCRGVAERTARAGGAPNWIVGAPDPARRNGSMGRVPAIWNTRAAGRVYTGMVTTTAPTSPRPRSIPAGPASTRPCWPSALFGGFVLGAWFVAPIFAVVLFLGAAFGPRYGPFLRHLRRARPSPPRAADRARGPSPAALRRGRRRRVPHRRHRGVRRSAPPPSGWVLSLIVAALAALSAATGICVGCELYLLVARRRGVVLAGGPVQA